MPVAQLARRPPRGGPKVTVLLVIGWLVLERLLDLASLQQLRLVQGAGEGVFPVWFMPLEYAGLALAVAVTAGAGWALWNRRVLGGFLVVVLAAREVFGVVMRQAWLSTQDGPPYPASAALMELGQMAVWAGVLWALFWGPGRWWLGVDERRRGHVLLQGGGVGALWAVGAMAAPVVLAAASVARLGL